MQVITQEQWIALMKAGHTNEVISAHYQLAPAAPQLPASSSMPAGAAPVAAGPVNVDLGDAAFGSGEGRIPEGDGRHIGEIIELFAKNTYYGPKIILRYRMVESTHPANEENGEYSKGFSLDKTEGFGKGRDEIKGLIADIVDRLHPDWQCRTRWENKYTDYVVAAGPGSPHAQPAKGLRFALRTELRQPTRGKNEWTKHEFRLVDADTTLASLGFGSGSTAPRAPLPMPSAPPVLGAVPPMPGTGSAPPPMPAPAVPSLAGVHTMPPGLPPGTVPTLPSPDGRPPGWEGTWPPA